MTRQTLIFFTLCTLVFGAGLARADDDHGWFSRLWGEARLDVAPVDNPTYEEECGSCHFAYQPGLLPARSWQALMVGLDDHFGENAELPAAEQQALLAYLEQNAADRSEHKRAYRIARSLSPVEVPLRITELRYFQRKHHEIPPGLVRDNPELGSFSLCNRCHTRAGKGSYNEHEVNIPGVGQWDD